MSANYDKILVNATTAATINTPVSKRFSTLLFLTAVAAGFTELIRAYSSIEGIDADEADLTTAVASDMRAALSHPTKNPTQLLVGKLLPDVNQVTEITINSSDDGNHTATINTTTYTFVASSNSDADIATGLAALVDADPGVGATAAANVITVTGASPVLFVVSAEAPSGTAPTVATTTEARNIETQLTAIKQVNEDWEVVVPGTHDVAEIEKVARWASQNERVQYAQVSDADVLAKADDNVVAKIVDAGYGASTALAWHSDDAQPAALTHTANRLSFDADQESASWGYARNLNSVTPNTITATQLQNLRDQFVNTYLTTKKQNTMGPARMLSGRQIKSQMTINWLRDRICQRVAEYILNRKDLNLELSYDEDGFELITNQILDVLTEAEALGHIRAGTFDNGQPFSRVITPRLATIGQSDKDQFRAPWRFTFVLRPELEGTDITGYGSEDEAIVEEIQLSLI